MTAPQMRPILYCARTLVAYSMMSCIHDVCVWWGGTKPWCVGGVLNPGVGGGGGVVLNPGVCVCIMYR